MDRQHLPWPERYALGTFVWRFPQVHLGIGLVGNALFITGTILFMIKQEAVGLWFFLVGSSGMALATLGEVLRALGRHRLAKFDVDPRAPDQRWSETGRRPSAIEYTPQE